MYIVQPNKKLFKQTQPSLTSYELNDVMICFFYLEILVMHITYDISFLLKKMLLTYLL